MLKGKPFIHLFKTPGGHYFYDVNRNTILAITKEIYSLLEEAMESKVWEEKKPANSFIKNNMLKKLIDEGFLLPSYISEIIHPVNNKLEYYINQKMRLLTLQITQQCNLRCNYCIYSGNYVNRSHANRSMNFETARKGIDFLLKHARERNFIGIGFYGGEPLLEFELVKQCIEYAEEKSEGREILFTLTSNGTVINKEIIQFFERHDVDLLISLDGPKHVHDKNRKFAFNNSGTFDKIMENLELILTYFPRYAKKISFSVVIDPTVDFQCLNDFFIDYETLQSFGPLANATNFIDRPLMEDHTLELGYNEHLKNAFNYEMFKTYLSKIGRLQEKFVSPITLLSFSRLKTIKKSLQMTTKILQKCHHAGPCIPGIDRLFMNVDGILYPCERVSEVSKVMSIGDIENGFDMEKVRNILNIGKITEDQCKNCWAVRFCYLCAGFADNIDNFSSDLKGSKCNTVRRTVDSNFKDYCSLREFGYEFPEPYEELANIIE